MNTVYGTHNHENILSHIIEEIFENFGASHELSEFFMHLITDTLIIFILLFLIMFSISFLQTYINYDKLKESLVKFNSAWAYLLAIGLGVISPFCSCTIIPVLIGMVNLGISTSLAICFLTSASLLNMAAVVTMYASTGLNFTLIYILSSLIIIIIVSICMSKISIKDSAKLYKINDCCNHIHKENTIGYRLHVALHNTMHVFKGAWIYIVVGVCISSATMIFIPIDKVAQVINNKFSVILAAVVGLPIHSDVFTILPILLLLKEMSIGVALTFTLATMSISLPSVILLSRTFKTKFIFIYSLILFILSILIGYIGILFKI